MGENLWLPHPCQCWVGLEQPGIVEDVLAQGRGWHWVTFKDPFQPKLFHNPMKCIQVNETKIKISFISERKTTGICTKYFEANVSFSFICFIRQEKLVSGPYQNTYLKSTQAAKDIRPVSSTHPLLSCLTWKLN